MEIVMNLKKSLSNFKFLLLALLITQVSCSTKQSTILVITDDKNPEVLNKEFTLFDKSTDLLHKEFYFLGKNLEDTVFTIKVNNKLLKYSVPDEGLAIINLTTEDLIAGRQIYQTSREKYIKDYTNDPIYKKYKDSLERLYPPKYKINEIKKPKDMAFLQPNSINILTYSSHNIVYGLNKTMPREIWTKKDKTEMPLYYKIYTINDFKLEISEANNSFR